MNIMTIKHITFAVLRTLAASTASAQTALPEGPGKAELQKVCGLCHQAERSAAVRLTREGWEGVIADMIARGARGTDQEFAAVLDYLSKHFLGEAARPLNINRANNIELESVAGLTRKEAAALIEVAETGRRVQVARGSEESAGRRLQEDRGAQRLPRLFRSRARPAAGQEG